MRDVPHIGHLGAHIERRSNCRRFLAYPTCGTTGPWHGWPGSGLMGT